jgi:hypothetical protein
MKRFLVVLLSLGLIVAFSMPASAVDVKFSGSYYAQGWYVDNHEMVDNNNAKAFISQRLRMQPILQIADGLTLTMRFDALEKKWGDQRWSGGIEENRNRLSNSPSALTKEQENIEFERSYVTFATSIGTFDVGYQQGSSLFGTSFLDSDESNARVNYTFPFGQSALVLSYEKIKEYMSTTATGLSNLDADDEAYAIGVITKFQGGEAGLIYKYIDLASNKPGTAAVPASFAFNPATGLVVPVAGVAAVPGYRSTLHVLNPYLKKTAGSLNVEAEAYYIGGKAMEYDAAAAPDVDAKAFGGYVKAQMNMGPAYAGAMLVYMTGDSDPTDDEQESGFMSALHWGENFSPCLILWNQSYQTWVGAPTGYAGAANSASKYMDNVEFVQLFGGFKPSPKLHVKAAASYAKAEEKPTGFVDDEYGTELDVTASYKIYNNLEYMVGAAYLWAGDYFKGTVMGNKIDNNYLLTHKLTLTF